MAPRGMARRADITGQRFGELVAVRPTGDVTHAGVWWLFQCDCGKGTERTVAQIRVGTRDGGRPFCNHEPHKTERRKAARAPRQRSHRLAWNDGAGPIDDGLDLLNRLL